MGSPRLFAVLAGIAGIFIATAIYIAAMR